MLSIHSDAHRGTHEGAFLEHVCCATETFSVPVPESVPWLEAFGSLGNQVEEFRGLVASLPAELQANLLVRQMLDYAQTLRCPEVTDLLPSREISLLLARLNPEEGLLRYQAMLKEIRERLPEQLALYEALGFMSYINGEGLLPISPRYSVAAPGSTLFAEMRAQQLRACYSQSTGQVTLLSPFSWTNAWASFAHTGRVAREIDDGIHEHVHWMDLGEGKKRHWSVPQILLASSVFTTLVRLGSDILFQKLKYPLIVPAIGYLGTSLITAYALRQRAIQPLIDRDRTLLSEVHAYEISFRTGSGFSRQERQSSTQRILLNHYGIGSELREALLNTLGSAEGEERTNLDYLESRNKALQEAQRNIHALHLLGMPEQDISDLVHEAVFSKRHGFANLSAALRKLRKIHGLSSDQLWERVLPCLESQELVKTALGRLEVRQIAQRHLCAAVGSFGGGVTATALREQIQLRFGVGLAMSTAEELCALTGVSAHSIQSLVLSQRGRLSPPLYNLLRRPSIAAEVADKLRGEKDSQVRLEQTEITAIAASGDANSTARFVGTVVSEKPLQGGPLHLWYPELLPLKIPASIRALIRRCPSRQILSDTYRFEWTAEVCQAQLSPPARIVLEDLCREQNEAAAAACKELVAPIVGGAGAPLTPAQQIGRAVGSVSGLVLEPHVETLPLYWRRLQISLFESSAVNALMHGDIKGAISAAHRARCLRQAFEIEKVNTLGTRLLECTLREPQAKHVVVLSPRTPEEAFKDITQLGLSVHVRAEPASAYTWHHVQRDFPLDWLARQGEELDDEAKEVLQRDLLLLSLVEFGSEDVRARAEEMILPIVNQVYPEQLDLWMHEVGSAKYPDLATLAENSLLFLRKHCPGTGQQLARQIRFVSC